MQPLPRPARAHTAPDEPKVITRHRSLSHIERGCLVLAAGFVQCSPDPAGKPVTPVQCRIVLTPLRDPVPSKFSEQTVCDAAPFRRRPVFPNEVPCIGEKSYSSSIPHGWQRAVSVRRQGGRTLPTSAKTSSMQEAISPLTSPVWSSPLSSCAVPFLISTPSRRRSPCRPGPWQGASPSASGPGNSQGSAHCLTSHRSRPLPPI